MWEKPTGKGQEAMIRYLRPPLQHQLVLGSRSPRRKHLLAEAGICPDCVFAADIDETPIKNEQPADYVRRMAREKAHAVAGQQIGQFILSADTAVVCGRRILPKAETKEEAKFCVELLSGAAIVYMAVSVCICQMVDVKQNCLSAVSVQTFSPSDKHAYLQSGNGRAKRGLCYSRPSRYVHPPDHRLLFQYCGAGYAQSCRSLLGAGFDYVQPE